MELKEKNVINLNIGGEVLSLRVSVDDEPNVRRAAAIVSNKVQRLKSCYPSVDSTALFMLLALEEQMGKMTAKQRGKQRGFFRRVTNRWKEKIISDFSLTINRAPPKKISGDEPSSSRQHFLQSLTTINNPITNNNTNTLIY